MYDCGIYSLRKQEAILKSAGINGVEICLAVFDPKEERMSALRNGENFGNESFEYTSLHLPSYNPNMLLQAQVGLASELVSRHNIKTAVIHPLKNQGRYPVEFYRKMISAGVPLAIENMDKRKNSGFLVEELKWLANDYGMPLVLDVQHAYEHDHSMGYANRLFWTLKDNVAHLHVSGETEGNSHSLVCRSRNAREIMEFVAKVLSVKNVPLILEGEYRTSEELKAEVMFIEQELFLRLKR